MTTLQIARIAHREAHNPMTPTPSIPAQTTARHTAGPWTVSGNQVQCERINAYGNFIICEIRREMTGEDEANARLIAAAPNLLKVIMDMEMRLRDVAQLIDGGKIPDHTAGFCRTSADRAHLAITSATL